MNTVIIIGDNHNNTLGLVRSFGKNGIKPYGIIVGGNGFVCKSRYWAKVRVAKDEVEAIKIMKDIFKDEKEKPVVLTCSDRSALLIDSNLDDLKEQFILPSISGKQGAIVDLMNKANQIKFAQSNHFKTASSWTLDLECESLPDDLVCPCIFKPLVSAKGNKGDIRIAETMAEALELLPFYMRMGYEHIMIQQYIDFQYEILVVGACGIYRNPAVVGRKLRIWPLKRGSTSYAVNEDNSDVLAVVDNVLNALSQIGYIGLVDIELFYTNHGVYLNEINFRNSAASAIAMASGIHYAVDYYYQMIGQKEVKLNKISNKRWYFMHEFNDFEYVRKKKMSYADWKKDKQRVNAFATYDKEDLLPYLYYPIYRIQMKARRLFGDKHI